MADEQVVVIEDFKTVTNGLVDYIGYLSDTELAKDPDQFWAGQMKKSSANPVPVNFESGVENFYRCGICKKNYGTRLFKADFQEWFDKFGGTMLNQAELRQLEADNTPEEGI